MLRLLFLTIVLLTFILRPIHVYAQSGSPSSSPLIRGVPPCAKFEEKFNSLGFKLNDKSWACYKYGGLKLVNSRDWAEIKPYMPLQDAVVDIYIKLPQHEVEDVFNSIIDPSRVWTITLIGDDKIILDKVPSSISRFKNLRTIEFQHWTGDEFPDIWSLGLNIRGIEVHTNRNINIPRAAFEDPNLRGITLYSRYNSIFGKQLISIPNTAHLARKWVGIPESLCPKSRISTSDKFTYRRPGKPRLQIEAPYIKDYCP